MGRWSYHRGILTSVLLRDYLVLCQSGHLLDQERHPHELGYVFAPDVYSIIAAYLFGTNTLRLARIKNSNINLLWAILAHLSHRFYKQTHKTPILYMVCLVRKIKRNSSYCSCSSFSYSYCSFVCWIPNQLLQTSFL